MFSSFFRRDLPRLAMAMTVRNEERFLESHLLYHRLLGVERVYLFLDRSTDRTEAIARQFDWVKIIELHQDMLARYRWIAVVQMLCMDKALEWAREEGFDWLLCCDPDEFCFGCSIDQFSEYSSDPEQVAKELSLVRMLDQVPSRTEQVLLRPAELLPGRDNSLPAMSSRHHYTISPELSRSLWDPATDTKVQWTGYLGHDFGKSIIRTTASLQASSSHHWAPDQQRRFPQRPAEGHVRTTEVGGMLHYVITSYQHWYEKYQKYAAHPLVYETGEELVATSRCYRNAVKLLNEKQLVDYYQKWVALPEEQLEALIANGQAFASDVVPRLTDYARKLYPASQSDSSKVFWNPVPSMPAEPETCFVYRPFDLVGEQIQGFTRSMLSKDKKTAFSWTQSQAGIRLRLPPDNYQITMQLHRVNKLCPQRVKAYLNDQPLEQPTDKLNRSKHIFTAKTEQFSAGENWLRLEFTPDESASAKRLTYRQGAPVTEIRFDVIPSHSARAA